MFLRRMLMGAVIIMAGFSLPLGIAVAEEKPEFRGEA